MGFAVAATLEEVWAGEMKACIVSGRRVLLLRTGDAVVAFEDRCAHQGVRISDGRWEGNVLTCPAHEWQYDARSGQGINPASARLHTFAVKVEDGKVWVDVEQPGGGS
jgi:toluene monooxygenase system ferredoxin subunit